MAGTEGPGRTAPGAGPHAEGQRAGAEGGIARAAGAGNRSARTADDRAAGAGEDAYLARAEATVPADALAYDAAATERWAPEPDKRPGRTSFQRDRARVLHSSALRRLAGKTQVVTPGTRGHVWDASPRTRLTHSLECAQVGRELGAALGCDPDLVETACLSHDLGHPPFGHNGEQVLSDLASDIGGFEGNAQSLRLLTRIEPKRFVRSEVTGQDESVGLNLTRAALDAATKYPWRRGEHPKDPGSVKFGAYEDDLPVFAWLRRDAPPHETCFEAQVMDWSDDVAYSVHDVEDGLHAGHIDPGALLADPERAEIGRVALDRGHVPRDADPQELSDALDRLLAQEWWPHGYDGSAPAQARLKDATSQLIGRFCFAAESATRAAYGPGRLTRYEARLVVPRAARLECGTLKAVADLYVIQRAEQAAIRAEQRVVVAELAEALTARAPEGLDPLFRALYRTAPDDRARRRVVIDQIASLTDASARSLHADLTGPGRGR